MKSFQQPARAPQNALKDSRIWTSSRRAYARKVIPLCLQPPRSSRMFTVGGPALAGRRPFRIARAGIGYVPQGGRIFPLLSVQEHLRLPAGKQSSGWTVERIYETFPRLAERRRNGGAELPGGEQQMPAIARALLLNPKVLVMDEPTEGLAPVIVRHLVRIFCGLADEGISLLLVEQNLAVAAQIAKRVLVMVNGRIALETSPAQFAANEELQHRYLGVGPAVRPLAGQQLHVDAGWAEGIPFPFAAGEVPCASPFASGSL